MSSVALPIEVAEFGNFESRMLRNFRMAIEDWDEVCSSLGDWELKHLLDEKNESSKAKHHAWVLELIEWGNLISQVTNHPDFPDSGLRTRVKARMTHLNDKLALWHSSLSEAEQDGLLCKVFA